MQILSITETLYFYFSFGTNVLHFASSDICPVLDFGPQAIYHLLIQKVYFLDFYLKKKSSPIHYVWNIQG